MRHINKKEPCQDFDDYIIQNELDNYLDIYIKNKTIKKHPWKKLGGNIKNKLLKHLYDEQKGLCVYCQQSFHALSMISPFDFSHIEHIKPKARNKYPENTFNQNNLSLSCNGFTCNNDDSEKDFCGHKKLEEYNPNYFLNPIECYDIEKHFEYTIEGKIRPSASLNKKEREKAEYMINTLKLNYYLLVDARKINFNDILENDDEKEVLDENAELLPAFFSMLKQLL